MSDHDLPPGRERILSMKPNRPFRTTAALIALAALLTAAPTASAFAGPNGPGPRFGPAGAPGGPADPNGGPPHGPPPPPDPVMGLGGMLLRGLDLTADQRTQVRDIVRRAMQGHLGELARAFGEARHALEVKVWDPSSTEQDMIALSGTVSERAVALESGRRQLAKDLLGILTEEQRDAFLERLADDPGPPPLPPPPPR